jgi:carboxylesterase
LRSLLSLTWQPAIAESDPLLPNVKGQVALITGRNLFFSSPLRAYLFTAAHWQGYNLFMSQIIPTAEPFFFPGEGKKARIGCLVTHGFTGTPKEMRWLGEYLNHQGYSVCGIRLNGHATRPEDMIRSHWRDWLLSVEDGYNLLRSCTGQVFLLGLSMGGVLTLTAAARFEIQGVVAMSTPFDLPPLPMPLWAIRWLSRVKPYLPKGRLPGSGWFDKAAYNQHVAYPMNPVRSGLELKLLIEEMHASLPRISVPVLLIHSRNDDYVIKDSMQQIYARLTTPDKQMLWVEGGGHVITEEPTKEAVFKAAADFVTRVSRPL